MKTFGACVVVAGLRAKIGPDARHHTDLVVRFEECGGAGNFHSAPFISFPLHEPLVFSAFSMRLVI